MTLSIITIICCLISAIIGIRESHLSNETQRVLLGLTYNGLILVLVAIIGSSATIYKKYLDYKDSINNKKLEQDKLRVVAIEARNAITPVKNFITEFLNNNGQIEANKVFYEIYSDEVGKEYPPPNIMDKVMVVFSKSSLYLPSNAKTYPEGKEMIWFKLLYDAIFESFDRSKDLLRHYGNVNHPIISIMNDFKNRSEGQLNTMRTISNFPGFREIWKNGISHEQHLEFFRYYFLTMVKAYRDIKEILKDKVE